MKRRTVLMGVPAMTLLVDIAAKRSTAYAAGYWEQEPSKKVSKWLDKYGSAVYYTDEKGKEHLITYYDKELGKYVYKQKDVEHYNFATSNRLDCCILKGGEK